MHTPVPASTESARSGLLAFGNFVAFFTGTSQGVVPLIARGIFGRRPVLSIATRWPAPWWWLGCTAFLLVAFAALVALDDAKQRHAARTEPT